MFVHCTEKWHVLIGNLVVGFIFIHKKETFRQYILHDKVHACINVCA